MDGHRRVEELTVTGVFAGVVTGTPVCPREGVFLHVLAPRLLVAACLREGQPRLDVFPCRTAVVTGRQEVHVGSGLPSACAGTLADGRLVNGRHLLRAGAHRNLLPNAGWHLSSPHELRRSLWWP